MNILSDPENSLPHILKGSTPGILARVRKQSKYLPAGTGYRKYGAGVSWNTT